jgi:ankyrin repeat protein
VIKAQLNQALIAEAYRRDVVHVARLLAQGANPNASDKAGVPVLFYAVAVKDNLLVITLLLGKGANVNARNPRGNTIST